MRRGSLPVSRPDNSAQRPRRCSRGRRAAIALAIAAFTLAGCAGAGQEPPPAVAEATQAPAVSPGTVELAERAIAEGRLRDAERILGQVLLVDPANTRALLALAEMHLADANLKQAAGVFGNLLDDPEVGPVANQGMGIAMLLAGIEDSGVAHLQRAVDADPSLWRAWNALGSHYDAGASGPRRARPTRRRWPNSPGRRRFTTTAASLCSCRGVWTRPSPI